MGELTQEINVLVCLHELWHEAVAQGSQNVVVLDLLGTGVPVHPCILVFVDKVVVHVRQVTLLIIDRLHSDIF